MSQDVIRFRLKEDPDLAQWLDAQRGGVSRSTMARHLLHETRFRLAEERLRLAVIFDVLQLLIQATADRPPVYWVQPAALRAELLSTTDRLRPASLNAVSALAADWTSWQWRAVADGMALFWRLRRDPANADRPDQELLAAVGFLRPAYEIALTIAEGR